MTAFSVDSEVKHLIGGASKDASVHSRATPVGMETAPLDNKHLDMEVPASQNAVSWSKSCMVPLCLSWRLFLCFLNSILDPRQSEFFKTEPSIRKQKN